MLPFFQDGSISKEEFAYCWNNWIKKIVRPVSAFLVIDVQNDFISGSLAITNCPAKQDGAEVNSHDILVEQTIMRNKGHNKATTRLQPYSQGLSLDLSDDECVFVEVLQNALPRLHFRIHDTFWWNWKKRSSFPENTKNVISTFLHKKVFFSKFRGFKLSKSLFLELGSKYFRSKSGCQKCILGKLSQCLKITQNVSFEILSFGTFYQFCPIIPDLSDNTV